MVQGTMFPKEILHMVMHMTYVLPGRAHRESHVSASGGDGKIVDIFILYFFRLKLTHLAKRRVDGSAIPAAPVERICILRRGARASRCVRQQVPLGIVAALRGTRHKGVLLRLKQDRFSPRWIPRIQNKHEIVGSCTSILLRKIRGAKRSKPLLACPQKHAPVDAQVDAFVCRRASPRQRFFLQASKRFGPAKFAPVNPLPLT